VERVGSTVLVLETTARLLTALRLVPTRSTNNPGDHKAKPPRLQKTFYFLRSLGPAPSDLLVSFPSWDHPLPGFGGSGERLRRFRARCGTPPRVKAFASSSASPHPTGVVIQGGPILQRVSPILVLLGHLRALGCYTRRLSLGRWLALTTSLSLSLSCMYHSPSRSGCKEKKKIKLTPKK